jgi:Tfp pilus assembly protein PilX
MINNKKTSNNKQGFALITSMIIMLVLMSLGIYAASFVLTDLRIAQSQAVSVKTYYLAESGIAEAIWRVKNDPTWKNNFENDPNWSITYQRSPALIPEGSYTISINNTEKATGEIKVTANLLVGNNQSQRVVKTFVYKALGEPVGEHAGYSDGNFDTSGAILNLFGGGIFSNNNIIINYFSTVNADKAIRAVGNINDHDNSTFNVPERFSKNYPPAPDPIPIPSVSFDDPNDPNSYKNLADQVYTKKQFEDLLWDHRGQTLTLNGIHYVTGDIELYGTNDLILNGVLVSDNDIAIGRKSNDCCWGSDCSKLGNITINRPSSSSPSGLISKRKIEFESCLNEFNAEGLIYSNDKIDIISLPKKATVKGGMVTRKITLTSLWQGLDLIYDNEIINNTLIETSYSPVVTVEHWEEEY